MIVWIFLKCCTCNVHLFLLIYNSWLLVLHMYSWLLVLHMWIFSLLLGHPVPFLHHYCVNFSWHWSSPLPTSQEPIHTPWCYARTAMWTSTNKKTWGYDISLFYFWYYIMCTGISCSNSGLCWFSPCTVILRLCPLQCSMKIWNQV